MVMESWEWNYFTFGEAYQPNNSTQTFGGGWEFAAAPDRPHQRIFTVKIPTVRYYMTSSGVMDITTSPELNLGRLKKFYERHSCYKPFIWTHPAEGNLKVRFKTPPEFPPGLPGGNGWIESFEVKLLELPGL